MLSEDAAVITVAEPIDADALRIRHEFLARPDLRLSARTVALLLDVSPRHAQRLLNSLARERFLQQESGGEYCRTAAA
jgi:DNA-binding IclR family transcriptional regulator